MRRSLALLIAFSACRLPEDTFVSQFAEADCTWLLACEDEATLTFNGWDTLEACVADRGPELAAQAVACNYDPKKARACVKAVEEQTCADGDRVFPDACTDIFFACTTDEVVDTSDSSEE